MRQKRNSVIKSTLLSIIFLFTIKIILAQQVEVQGELKVTEMNTNDTQDNLVVRNSDGTLGTRSVASLPPPPPPIDTTRNLASDFELAKHLCDCPNLPPFMIKKLLESGYTQEELVGSGVPIQNVIDAQRAGVLIDSRDNKSYKTVTIGSQTWMAENLNIGTMIYGENNQMNNSIIEKSCYDDISTNCEIYGGLYQWTEMMQYITTESTQGICPTGWHVPSDNEWKILEMELGMTQAQADGTGNRGTDQGSQLSGNESLWDDGALDQSGIFGSSGLALLPAGYSNSPGVYFGQNTSNDLWTSTENNSGSSWERYIFRNYTTINRSPFSKTSGLSVRCVED